MFIIYITCWIPDPKTFRQYWKKLTVVVSVAPGFVFFFSLILSSLPCHFWKPLLLCQWVPPSSCRTFRSRSWEGGSRHCKENRCPFPSCSPSAAIPPFPTTLAWTAPSLLFFCLVRLQLSPYVEFWRCVTLPFPASCAKTSVSELGSHSPYEMGSVHRWTVVFPGTLCSAMTVCCVCRITSSSGQVRAMFCWTL